MNAPLTSLEQALARIASLEAQVKSQATAKHTLKVGTKGTLCLYHGARYPIALYASQWEHLIPFIKSGAIEKFIEANRALLAADKA